MKNILYVFILLSFIACNNPIIEKIASKHPDGGKERVSYYQDVDGEEVLIEEKHYHVNGILKMTGKFLNGKREGDWTSYFNNEQLQSTGVFKNGLRTGIANIYFPNGQLRYAGQYENDKATGHWKFYNEEGKLVEEKDFK